MAQKRCFRSIFMASNGAEKLKDLLRRVVTYFFTQLFYARGAPLTKQIFVFVRVFFVNLSVNYLKKKINVLHRSVVYEHAVIITAILKPPVKPTMGSLKHFNCNGFPHKNRIFRGRKNVNNTSGVRRSTQTVGINTRNVDKFSCLPTKLGNSVMMLKCKKKKKIKTRPTRSLIDR